MRPDETLYKHNLHIFKFSVSKFKTEFLQRRKKKRNKNNHNKRWRYRIETVSKRSHNFKERRRRRKKRRELFRFRNDLPDVADVKLTWRESSNKFTASKNSFDFRANNLRSITGCAFSRLRRLMAFLWPIFLRRKGMFALNDF